MLARRRAVRQGGLFKHSRVSMEQQAREQAFISALSTQRFVLQAARSANAGEMTGRGTVAMGRCPAAWSRLGSWPRLSPAWTHLVAVVVPSVFLLGESSFA